MTKNLVARRAGVTRSLAGIAARRTLGATALITGLLLAACANNQGPAGSTLRVYAADLANAAKVCDVPAVNPATSGSLEMPMKVANDGGWCGIHVHQAGPKPFDAGLLTTRPSHGTVLIHEVGDETRIDYTPDHGFAGSDTFAVQLIPGNATIHVMVTVSAPAPAAPKA